MWSGARIDLGLSSAEFWSLAPRQYIALMRRKRDEYVRQEYMPALIVATLYNVAPHFKSKKVLTPDLFMPSMSTKKREEPSNVEKMMAIAKAKTIAMGGTVGGSDSS